MKILHTSDWHLGRTLEGRDRKEEQEAFVNEICDIIEREGVQLVLIAGDVFDSSNPPAAAEQLFYAALDRMASGGERAVVVIAGNHDSPERLSAANPLAARAGISLIGLPKEVLLVSDTTNGRRVRCTAAGASWLEIEIPGCPYRTVVAALPYPSEARLNEILSKTLNEEALQQAYTHRIELFFDALSEHFRADTVNLAMSHLFVRDGKESDSERPIQLGGAYAVEPLAFPASAHYIALGHLHRPQSVSGSPVLARYSGSPLAYSFSEAGQTKSVMVIEAEPGCAANPGEIPLSSGQPLVLWKAEGGLQEVERWCEDGRDPKAWIDLKIHVTNPLTMDEIQKLRKLRPNFVHICPVFPEMAETFLGEHRSQLPIDDLFRRFFERQTGAKPDNEMVELFLDLLSFTPSGTEEEGMEND